MKKKANISKKGNNKQTKKGKNRKGKIKSLHHEKTSETKNDPGSNYENAFWSPY
jgi:hypothetical protein